MNIKSKKRFVKELEQYNIKISRISEDEAGGRLSSQVHRQDGTLRLRALVPMKSQMAEAVSESWLKGILPEQSSDAAVWLGISFPKEMNAITFM